LNHLALWLSSSFDPKNIDVQLHADHREGLRLECIGLTYGKYIGHFWQHSRRQWKNIDEQF